MSRRVLLPLDLTLSHDAVFDAAVDLAGAEAATLLLLHVIEPIRDLSDRETEEFLGSLRERARGLLEEWSRALESRGVATECEIRTGKRGSTIVRTATEQRCDLIVMTSHAVDPERPDWGFGSTSHQVALMAPCSVLLVR